MKRADFSLPSLRALAMAGALVLIVSGCASPDAPASVERVQEARAMMADPDQRSPVGVWQERTTLGAVTGASIAFDRTRGKVVLFGGLSAPGEFLDDTWEWDANDARWLRLHPPNSPPSRAFTTMAFDEWRERVVLFSGSSFNPLSDTWEWDGATWTERIYDMRPDARQDHQMAFDPETKEVLLFGGFSFVTMKALGDTWTWNGETWKMLADGSGRDGPAMAFDRGNNNVVRFGGFDPSYETTATTTVWSKTSWMTLNPSVTPPPRHNASLAEADGGLLLFGGRDATALDDTWQWNGATWSPIPTTLQPSPRLESAMAWDGKRVVLAGGADNNYHTLNDTWLWNGTWTKSTASNPPAAMYPRLAYDEKRRRVVLFGGFDADNTAFAQTWEWDGDWRQKSPTHSPPPRYAHVMTYDLARGVTVVFGGRIPGKELGDTWTWNGDDWTEASPQHSPMPRWDAAMAYDHARKLTVLHGGTNKAKSIDDETWVWDGDDWAQLSVEGPGIRNQHALVNHRGCKELVLFGGFKGMSGAAMASNETWLWDGESWSLASPSSAPVERSLHAMTYNTFRERVILFGGQLDTKTFGDVWEWNGAEWYEVNAPNGPAPMERGAFAFAEEQRGALFFGGELGGPPHGQISNETWLYKTRGGSCDADAQCDTQHCLIPAGAKTGVCCEEASCGVCQACDTEADPGRCVPAPEAISCGEPVYCGDGFVKLSTCDGAGMCVPEKDCVEDHCENTDECKEGFRCRSDHRCVPDEPFPAPYAGYCTLAPIGGEARHEPAILVALAALAAAVARRRRTSPQSSIS